MKKHNVYILILIFLTVTIFIYSNLNTESFTNDIKENYLPKKISGNLNEIQNIKGGSIYLSVLDKGDYENITISNDEIRDKINTGIYFEKLPYSNMCFVTKDDSIMFFDCYVFSKEDSMKIGKVQTWRKIKNKWIYHILN